MSEETRKMIDETVENLKQMDESSLRIMQSNAEVLRTRDAMDKQQEEKEA